MSDPVREYLEEQGYADYIVEGGLQYLITAWEALAASLEEDEVQSFQQYIKDVDRRNILEKVLPLAPSPFQAMYEERVAEADERVRAHLVAADGCVVDPDVASEHQFDPEREWWYFHRPEHIDDSWD